MAHANSRIGRNRLWIQRKAVGYSQKDVASLLGHKTAGHISDYERGKRLPSLETALKLDIILGYPVGFLFRSLRRELKEEVQKKRFKGGERSSNRNRMSKIRSRDHADSYADSRYFYTHDLYLAAFLYAHGLWLSNAEQDAEGKYRFAFRRSGELDTREREFRYASQALVDARTLTYAIEELKRRASRLGSVNHDE